ncbi:cytochrome b family protein [Sulfurospirillum multivorans DSM 12446]|uniref:Cytochrome b family protein n=3 Tax=Sulfurospirillum multivorans TaxID=66821 RepID=A0AA86ANR4_SULMK|nr:cytochrome b family protein [Sulfurospirillum multivorans DSM 12446]QEH06615.1 cytochrome b family protein [Sulfurospirillum multivorans]
MRTNFKEIMSVVKTNWLHWTLKLNHWALLLMAIFLGVTGWLGCTSFSVPHLMHDTAEFIFNEAEIVAGNGAKFILSRVIRGELYQYHFLVGIVMYAAMVIGVVLAFTKNGIKKNPITILFLISMTLLLVSGWFRYYRGTIPFMEVGYYRGLYRNIHHYSAWALLWTSVIHIIHMIYLNATKYRNIISRMFESGGFTLKMITGLSLLTLSAGMPLYADSQIQYESLRTFEKMSAPKEGDMDDLFLKGVIPSSRESAEVLADFYWAKKCTNSLDGVVMWNEKDKFCRSRKFAILLDLKERENDKDALYAYKAIVLSERINNCGKTSDAALFYDNLKK